MGADHFDRRLCVANAITDSYCDFHTHGDSYSNSDIYTDANCDADINTHRDSYGNSKLYSNSYRDGNIHADSDTCGESNANSYGHVYANPNGNSYCNGNPDCNGDRYASLCCAGSATNQCRWIERLQR